MTFLLLPDGLEVAKAWAKANSALAAIFDTRISRTLPDTANLTFPYLRVFVVPGASPDDLGHLEVLTQWDVFAAPAGDDRGTPDMDTASLGARTLETELITLQRDLCPLRLVVGGSPVAIEGAEITTGAHPIPEPRTGWARQRVDALLTMKATI